MIQRLAVPQQTDLFETAGLPEGFRYREDAVTAAAAARLAQTFALLPFKPFEFQGFLGNRRIVSYGYRYDYSAKALQKSEALPDFLDGLRAAASDISGVSAAAFEQALITEYAPGAGIGWHRDKPMFDEVAAFSFLAPCVLRFRRRQGAGWERRKQLLTPRSAYVLGGPARREWEHSIPPVAELRYSVTFRNFV